jgi:hypothetical protein
MIGATPRTRLARDSPSPSPSSSPSCHSLFGCELSTVCSAQLMPLASMRQMAPAELAAAASAAVLASKWWPKTRVRARALAGSASSAPSSSSTVVSEPSLCAFTGSEALRMVALSGSRTCSRSCARMARAARLAAKQCARQGRRSRRPGGAEDCATQAAQVSLSVWAARCGAGGQEALSPRRRAR